MEIAMTGFVRPGVPCQHCGEPFALALVGVQRQKEVEKLPDPFQAKCPFCQTVASYPKSAIDTLVAVTHP